jgi:predicted transcriptional regulator
MVSRERAWDASGTNRNQPMNVGKVCSRDVVTAREFDELNSATELMRENHVGYLVVVK